MNLLHTLLEQQAVLLSSKRELGFLRLSVSHGNTGDRELKPSKAPPLSSSHTAQCTLQHCAFLKCSHLSSRIAIEVFLLIPQGKLIRVFGFDLCVRHLFAHPLQEAQLCAARHCMHPTSAWDAQCHSPNTSWGARSAAVQSSNSSRCFQP